MFVVKDPDLFAATIIPQYFDHNKFSSFARQLNFYGFRKMQAKPIRNSDFDVDSAKHVTFYNEKFKRGRCDLLKEIQRSTRGGGAHTTQDHAKEVADLRETIGSLESKITEINQSMEERMRRLELDMLGRMEQMMLAMQHHQQTQLQLQQQVSTGTNGDANMRQQSVTGEAWDPLPLDRAKSSNTNVSFSTSVVGGEANSLGKKSLGPTLPPHPKQKQFPPITGQGVPNALGLPPSRMNSLRGISRGVSRGVSEQSSASAVLLRNSWEDKFFSMLMLGENEQSQAVHAAAAAHAHAQAVSGRGISDEAMEAAIANETAGLMKSDRNGGGRIGHLSPQHSERTLSSVSDTEAI
mmetsp:Transcript_21128/g.34976  ORF Transcript_21128/g.34976 Transcript_21128/m.34976 type:complete len:352 (-) Transcript_21128:443-1498(-)